MTGEVNCKTFTRIHTYKHAYTHTHTHKMSSTADTRTQYHSTHMMVKRGEMRLYNYMIKSVVWVKMMWNRYPRKNKLTMNNV